MVVGQRKIAFVLAATDQGTYLVNRFDYKQTGETAYGVGYELLETAAREPEEVNTAMTLLSLRRDYFGDGVVGIDCGANIGLHAISWARKMTGWGQVIAIEAQERIYYALCGNITLNNVFNAQARHAAVSREVGGMRIPVPNYLAPASFGSLELQRTTNEHVGQDIDYSQEAGSDVAMISLDSMKLPRVDLIKIDVEGMELDVLAGATEILTHLKPCLLIERLKTNERTLFALLASYGYQLLPMGINVIAVHESDPTRQHVQFAERG